MLRRSLPFILVAFCLTTLAALADWRPPRAGRRDQITNQASAVSTPPDAGSFDALPANARIYVSITGESQAVGFNNDAGASATDADGLRSTDAGVIVLTEVGASSPETSATQTERFINNTDSLHRQVMVGNWGVTGASYVNLAQGQGTYSYGLRQITSGNSFIAANRVSEALCTTALAVILGANDEVGGTTAATFSTNMQTLRANFETDTVNKCLGHLPLFAYSHSTSTQLNPPVPFAETAIGVYMASKADSRVCTFFAGYSVAPVAGDAHYTGASQRRMGCYLGHAVLKYAIEQTGCLGLEPDTVTAINNVVTVCMRGGDGSALAIDTTNVVRKGSYYGFWYDDNQDDVPVITNVALNGTRCVDLTLSRNAQAPATVSYADFGSILIDPGPAAAQSLGGNIRDADATTCAGESLALNNWLVPFRQDSGSVSGSASAAPSFSNTQSVDSNGAAANLISARSITTLNGQANGSVQIYFRSNAATFPGATNVMLTNSQSQNRQIDIRTGTGGSVVFAVPISINDTANFCTVAAGTFLGQTWYHVLFVKSGSSALVVYVNGVSVLCTQTGTVPANFQSPVRSTWAIGSSVGNSSNFNYAHVAVWDRALSAADAQELNGGVTITLGTPIDARTLSTGGPEHYWMFQGTFEDVGNQSAHTRNLLTYGTGITFEAIHP